MADKTLYSIIGVLLAAILGLGLYAAFSHPSETAQLPASAVSVVQEAVGGIAADYDVDGDAAQDTDDDGDGSAAPALQQTAPAQPGIGSTQAAATFTMAQVRQHNSAASCYAVVGGSVYDLTTWINQHPGGPDKILALCGTDGTAAFEAQHSGQRRPENELASRKIGTLAQ